MTLSQIVDSVQESIPKKDNRQSVSFDPVAEGIESSSLDLFSITQTSAFFVKSCAALKQAFCINNAPYFAMKLATDKSFAIAQGCCNDWNCPKCGQKRAKKEYGRIIEGCREIAKKHEIYFITLTCRGKQLSLEAAENGYGKWTNRLLTACRTRAKRENQFWSYVQVTERQKRGHPHSHVLTTWKPHDLRLGTVDKWQTLPSGRKTRSAVTALRSDWLEARCVSAGLGDQYDISKVDTVEGASRYVAKYLFKDSMFETIWRKKWQRIRYSNSFPKLPEMKSDAMALVTEDDWRELASKALIVRPTDAAVMDKVKLMFMNDDIIIRTPKPDAVN